MSATTRVTTAAVPTGMTAPTAISTRMTTAGVATRGATSTVASVGARGTIATRGEPAVSTPIAGGRPRSAVAVLPAAVSTVARRRTRREYGPIRLGRGLTGSVAPRTAVIPTRSRVGAEA